MTDIPIIFSGPMVRALLDSRKTMTRRLAWRWKDAIAPDGDEGLLKTPTSWQRAKVGDRLWVRENFAYVGTSDPGFLTYQATYPEDLSGYGIENVPTTLKEAGYRWTPCIHMPRRLSRLTLIVTETMIEPLLDISEDDARAEGFEAGPLNDGFGPRDFGGGCTIESPGGYASAAGMFQITWAKLNPGWDGFSSPDVVALTFRVIKANIDAPEARVAA